MENKSAKHSKVLKITFWSSLVAVALLLAYLIWYFCSLYLFTEEYDQVASSFASGVQSSSQSNGEGPVLVENPVDFNAEKAKYPDLYAWIIIPDNTSLNDDGTPTLLVNQPVVQSLEDDSFYLDHGPDKKYNKSGSIYSEMKNNPDFSDPNTILYGHNMRGYKMFGALHKFRTVKGFFEANKYMYIYLPGRKLTYEICAAYRTDNTHILNAHNFSDPAVFNEYLETVKNPKSVIVKKRETTLNTNSKILTLSTCIGNPDYRYVVQGVLVNEEQTK